MSEQQSFSQERVSQGQIVKGQIEQQEFFDFLENETQLYALNYLGYPWYWAGKFSIVDNCMERGARSTSPQVQEQLVQDFVQKVPMLSQQYDYAFIVKSKMRSFADSQIENPMFLEIFDYLAERGKSFIIFERAENDARCDLKYLSSKYAANTISYGLTRGMLEQPLAGNIKHHAETYIAQLNTLLAGRPRGTRFESRLIDFEKLYYDLVNVIPWIVMNQFLLDKMQVKALFGGMGSFVQAGLSNAYPIIEVGHSYFGRSLHVPTPHLPVMNYLKANFKMNHCYHLALTTDGKVYSGDDILNLEENRIDFGMPALRNYPFSAERVASVRQRLGLENCKVVLIATNGWVDYGRLQSLIDDIQARHQEAVVLLRPHPSYENAAQHNDSSDRVRIVLDENKNDLFAVSDVVITVPSSMAVEAQPFTENIVVMPDITTDNIFGREVLENRYPHAKVVSLMAREEMRSLIDACFADPKRCANPKASLKAASACLDELFQRIGA